MLVRPNRLMTKSSNNANVTSSSMAMDFTTGSLDPKISFSRASNATVTGSNGLIQYAPHNLLTYSEQFDNSAWGKVGATISANATTAPDGTITADKFVETATTGSKYLTSSTFSAGTYTFSIYVKFSGKTFFWISLDSSATAVFFNLSTGTVAATGAGNVGSITAVGSGWYRCYVTSTPASARAFFGTSDTSSSYTSTGNGTDGAFLWGAQLEVGSTATTYNPTTVKNLLGYSEAFDNAAWTKSNSFVQTNLFTFSEQFDNAAWTTSNATVTANTTIAPNGTTTADSLIENSASADHYVGSSVSFTSGTSYTYSCYVKPNGRNWFRLSFSNSAFPNTERFAYFDVQNGVLGTVAPNVTAAITSVGNGWYRCSISRAATVTTPGTNFLVLCNADNNTTYTGDGVSGAFIWGAQIVQGSVAGDYQQTTSAALPVQYQAPNGTMTADKLVENTVNAGHTIDISTTVISGTIYTTSIYAKAGERTQFSFRTNSDNTTATFNLSAGTIGTVTNGTGSITAVGNGWYRCSLTWTATSSASVVSLRVRLLDGSGNSSYTGDGTSGIYIWGAQLSDSASLDTYVNNPVAAPTAAAYYGARFDYDPVTLQPKGLLIEEQRTNLALYSSDFDNAVWTKAQSTVTANTTVSPDGTQNADLFTPTISGNTSSTRLLGTIVVSTATAYTASVYVKSAGRRWAFFAAPDASANSYNCWFDLQNGVVGTKGASVTSASIMSVGNGWYRISATSTSTNTTNYVFISSTDADNSTTVTADGNGLYVWGAQLEAGAFATSYIPTTTAQVTRSADVALVQGSNFSSWYNVNEGSFMADTTTGTDIVSSYSMTALNVSQTSILGFDIDSSGVYRLRVTDSGVNQALVQAVSLTAANTRYKISGAYRTNDFAATANGGVVTVDTSGTVPAGMSFFVIGSGSSAGISSWNGHIRQIAYYPTRLQNSQLQAITS